eukprot:2761778-Pleurochrysis_carterae.AAC.1
MVCTLMLRIALLLGLSLAVGFLRPAMKPAEAPPARVKKFPGCICDQSAFMKCPGHTADGLRGLRLCVRPCASTDDAAEHAKQVLRKLLPNDSKEQVAALTFRKTPWRAAISFYWRGLSADTQADCFLARRHLPDAIPYTDYGDVEDTQLAAPRRPPCLMDSLRCIMSTSSSSLSACTRPTRLWMI